MAFERPVVSGVWVTTARSAIDPRRQQREARAGRPGTSAVDLSAVEDMSISPAALLRRESATVAFAPNLPLFAGLALACYPLSLPVVAVYESIECVCDPQTLLRIANAAACWL